MLFIVQKNVQKKITSLNYTLIVTDNKNIKNKKNTKKNLRTSRLKRLEKQLKSNIMKRKLAKKNNG